ncbi:TetR/AcrR family transcriptional regulator [Flexivirga caeni]|uniref:TetR/AcrR family transcriptional regulator n=1 Tax=Flexivirga caeni TaxID=2294115 RepID=UPI001C65E3DF|nr:TetR/AcrR family transcriptional regulator [Flexivirga caeni]
MSTARKQTATGRAAPLPLPERREALIVTAIALIRERHMLPTTREIAQAAGVAEGTIFRAFATKDELFDAVLDRTFEAGPFFDRLAKIDGAAGLEQVMIDIVSQLQARFVQLFEVMGAFSLMGPPERFRDPKAQREQEEHGAALIHGLLEPYAGELRLPVNRVAQLMRLLTFSGSHQRINDGEILAPEEIVHTILFGVTTDVRIHHEPEGN